MNATNELVAKIEEQLERLDCLCTNENPGGLCVSAEDDLPRGWVRVYDTESAYGPANEILAALESVGERAWESLADFDSKPESTQNWPSDLFRVEQLEEGTVNDNPACLITVETNAGTRYTCGAHGVSCCALGDLFSNGGDLCKSREEAVAEYEELAAENAE